VCGKKGASRSNLIEVFIVYGVKFDNTIASVLLCIIMEQHSWDFPDLQMLWPCGVIRVSREGLTVWFDTNLGDAKCLYVQGPEKRSVFWHVEGSGSAYDSGAVMRSMMLNNPDALITSLLPEHAVHVVFDTARYIIKELTGGLGPIEYSITTWSATKPDGNQALVMRAETGAGVAVVEQVEPEDTCTIC